MDKKYPVANLSKKRFLQTNVGVPTKMISWCSTFNDIYFPQTALLRINSLYGMQLNAQILSDEDQIFLDQQEFILLHEAGHIEHNDISNGIICSAAVYAALIATGVSLKSEEQSNKAIKAGITAFVISYLLGRYNERNADAFAYQNGDERAIKGGISLFQSEEVDPLFNIENKQRSPFIHTDSTIGKITQSVFACIEIPAFYIDKTIGSCIQSTHLTRYLYDLGHDLVHPGPPARVYAMQQELERRLQEQQPAAE